MTRWRIPRRNAHIATNQTMWKRTVSLRSGIISKIVEMIREPASSVEKKVT